MIDHDVWVGLSLSGNRYGIMLQRRGLPSGYLPSKHAIGMGGGAGALASLSFSSGCTSWYLSTPTDSSRALWFVLIEQLSHLTRFYQKMN